MQAQRGRASASGCGFAWAQRVHVVGVAGSGLRGMVHILCERGAQVSGSEMLESPVLEKFRLRGVKCRVGHAGTNVEQGTNLVLISAAVKPNNPEVTAAQSRSIPVWKYSECLGRLMAERNGIAVAGTHGKTTTTAMVTTVLRHAGLDPSYLIGGEHPELGSSCWGSGEHFVAEACEFDRSFLHLRPRYAIVTNVEEEHLDYFKSLQEIQKAFAEFVSLLPEDGFLTINRDDPNSSLLSEFCRSRVGTFSLRPGAADYWADRITYAATGTRRAGGVGFRLVHQGKESVPVWLQVPGEHNIRNALAAAAVCHDAGVPLEMIAEGLETFRGVRRRFDVIGDGAVTVVDDYAHHPTEIRAAMRGARAAYPGRRLTAVLQPHQHSRLRRFLPEFVTALSGFDRVVVTEVFRSRDTDEDARNVRAETLFRHLAADHDDVAYAPTLADVERHVTRVHADGDVFLFLGAGSITEAAKACARNMGCGQPDVALAKNVKPKPQASARESAGLVSGAPVVARSV